MFYSFRGAWHGNGVENISCNRTKKGTCGEIDFRLETAKLPQNGDTHRPSGRNGKQERFGVPSVRGVGRRKGGLGHRKESAGDVRVERGARALTDEARRLFRGHGGAAGAVGNGGVVEFGD